MLDDIDNLLDEAIAAHKVKDFSRAMSKYNKILENDAHHEDANYNFGLLTEEIGLKNEALIFFQSALNTNPNRLQYWEAFVKILIELEKFDEAKITLKQAQTAGHHRVKTELTNQFFYQTSYSKKNGCQCVEGII